MGYYRRSGYGRELDEKKNNINKIRESMKGRMSINNERECEEKGKFSLKEGGKETLPNILMHIFRVCMAPSPAVGVRAGGSSASTIPRVGIGASCITDKQTVLWTVIHTFIQ